MTDDQLIIRFLDGQVNAFNTLVWRWEKRLYNFILRYVGDREDAKDLCQKTFIQVYQDLRRLRDPGKFSTWVHQIAVNLCRDELRNRHRRPMLSLEGLQEDYDDPSLAAPEMAAAPSMQPDAAAHRRDMRELLNAALQTLPEEQRVVVIMKEYQELKFAEIAEILGISVNTAKSRMYYGLGALRKVFDQWNISQEVLGYEV